MIRSKIKDRVLIALDKCPRHGYELQQLLSAKAENIDLTTLYRLLHEMESEGFVESKMQEGPYGPRRRVYQAGPKGESRLREILRDSIEIVLHFYDEYRHEATKDLLQNLNRIPPQKPPGPILFSVFPYASRHDLDLMQALKIRAEDEALYLLGETNLTGKPKVPFKSLKGKPWDIAQKSDRFSEVWMNRLPPREKLPRTIVESKRVLKKKGILRILAPFAFFGEPAEPSLETFIRVTSVHLFPELGVVEGDEVSSVMEMNFEKCGAFQIFPGFVVFWGVKE